MQGGRGSWSGGRRTSGGRHVHLVVEADDKRALSNGVRAFMISAARAINRAKGRSGTVFPTRYHAVLLRTSRQVRNAIA